MEKYIAVAVLIAIGVVIFALLLVGDDSLFTAELDTNTRALDYIIERT